MHRTIAFVTLSATGSLLLACGGSDKKPADRPNLEIPDTCNVRLPSRAAPLAAEAPPPPPPPPSRPSRLVANVELKLAAVAKELEAKIGARLAEERGKGIGVAGHLNYTVDRGPFSLAVENDALVVRTDIRSRAEACRGSRCYASCEPQGRATATVPLRLTADYRFPPSKVSFAFTRGCEVRALGGMLKIDVTPTIQSQLQGPLRRVEEEIDRRLPPLRPQAERLWNELQKTRTLPLGMCIVTSPRAIVEGPTSGAPDALRVRFGLVAYPEVRARCPAADAPPKPLPPLAQDPALPPEDDLLLTIVSPLQTALGSPAAGQPIDVGPGRSRVDKTTSVPAGNNAVRIDLALAGEVCGDLAVTSGLVWSDDVKTLRLAGPTLPDGERARATAASIVPEKLLRSLGTLGFTPPLAPDSLDDVVPGLVQSMSDETVDIRAKVSRVKPAEVVVRGDDLAAAVLVRGSVELRQK